MTASRSSRVVLGLCGDGSAGDGSARGLRYSDYIGRPADSADLDCSIFLVDREGRVRVLRCGHMFHADCVEEWLKKKKLCPLCNFPIDGQENPEGAEEGGSVAEGAAVGPSS